MPTNEQLRTWRLERLIRDDRLGEPGWLARKLNQVRADDAERDQLAIQDHIRAQEFQAAVTEPFNPNNWQQQRGQLLGLSEAPGNFGQHQGTGRMEGVQLPETKPGQDYMRAAQALAHPMGPDARREYGERQRAAANVINGFRPQAR